MIILKLISLLVAIGYTINILVALCYEAVIYNYYIFLCTLGIFGFIVIQFKLYL